MNPASPRKVEVLVLSDIHLGTYGCHAKELNRYLKSIDPEIIILNGDIIDMWQFSKRYWPKEHMKVIKKLVKYMAEGKRVYYITGNHDEMLRRFADFELGTLTLTNKLLLDLDGKRTWIFHGDVFDVSMQYSKWLAKLGGKGYDLLILINRAANFISEGLGKGRISLSKRVKDGVKKAVKFVSDFEKIAAEIAIDNRFDTVICGHIHQPQQRIIENSKGQVLYLNSGDWIENLTALEYNEGEWRIYEYFSDPAMRENAQFAPEESETADTLPVFISPFEFLLSSKIQSFSSLSIKSSSN
ncbi:MAG: UDP-2,3-diacylglucosamine diphosphatase [Flavobacteriales bacterium]|nr:UDP-2,3-diacylglucosamine diphosphatase [Flavobacteriales bacterium]